VKNPKIYLVIRDKDTELSYYLMNKYLDKNKEKIKKIRKIL
jgi:hypothetical protein